MKVNDLISMCTSPYHSPAWFWPLRVSFWVTKSSNIPMTACSSRLHHRSVPQRLQTIANCPYCRMPQPQPKLGHSACLLKVTMVKRMYVLNGENSRAARALQTAANTTRPVAKQAHHLLFWSCEYFDTPGVNQQSPSVRRTLLRLPLGRSPKVTRSCDRH